MTDETELIRRSQAGDLGAFSELSRRYEKRIHLLALNFCRNSHDAEDLSQDVWLKAFKSLGSFRFDSSFYTWLRRITINTFLNNQRSRSFFHRAHVSLFESTAGVEVDTSSNEAAELIHSKVLFASVVNALSELTPSQRLMFLLRHYEGMSYSEIANAMNCSVGTVKKSVWRAILKIKAKLDASPEETDETLSRLVTEH